MQSIIGPDANDDTDASSESAALARGAARTARTARTAAIDESTSLSSSSASASAARGGGDRLRTAAENASRAIAGGTPQDSARGAASSFSRFRMPDSSGATNVIARASDRASLGLDVLSASLEERENASESNSRKKEGDATARRPPPRPKVQLIPPVASRMISTLGVFATNTVLGMAVFSTYEATIERLAPTSSSSSSSSSGEDGVAPRDGGCEGDCDVSAASSSSSPPSPRQRRLAAAAEEEEGALTTTSTMDAMDRAALPLHFLAGAAGGAAHAALSLALGMTLAAGVPPPSPPSLPSGVGAGVGSAPAGPAVRVPRVPAARYSFSIFLHHSLSHSVLFGTYHLSKRSLARLRPHLRRDGTAAARDVDDDDALRFATVAVAGGLAGQCQHVVGHVSERWLGLAAEAATANAPPRSSSPPSSLRRYVMSPSSWPTWRSTALTFPLSAVGFLAFEYGKLMTMTGDDGDVSGGLADPSL